MRLWKMPILSHGDAKAARKENVEGKEDARCGQPRQFCVSGTLNQAGNSRVITIEIDGVQCQGVQVVTAHTKIRCVAPRMSRLRSMPLKMKTMIFVRIRMAQLERKKVERLERRNEEEEEDHT